MKQESRYIKIIDRLEIILDWKWQATEEEGRRKDGKSFTNTVNKLTLYTDKQAFTVWDTDGKIHGFPSFINAFSPDVEMGLPQKGDARPVNLFWNVEGGGTLCGYSGGVAYMLTRDLTPEERERLKPNSAMKAEPRKTAESGFDKLAARMDTVLKITGLDGKPTRGQLIVDEVRKRHRNGAEVIDVLRTIASEAFEAAKMGKETPWLNRRKMIAVHNNYQRGVNHTKADIYKLADTLKRVRNRAIAKHKPTPKNTKRRK